MKSDDVLKYVRLLGVSYLLAVWAASSATADVYRVAVSGVWSGGDPTLIGSAIGLPYRWELLFDEDESPTENFRDDAANVVPEAQYTYAADGSTRTLFLDPDTSSDTEPKLGRAATAVQRLQLTNDLTNFPPFGPIPATDVGAWIDGVVTSVGPKDIRIDTPLVLAYQNTLIDSSLNFPGSVGDWASLFSQAAASGAPLTVSVTGLGSATIDPRGAISSIEFALVPEPGTATMCVTAFAALALLRAAAARRRI
jgi:hypothetical protein